MAEDEQNNCVVEKKKGSCDKYFVEYSFAIFYRLLLCPELRGRITFKKNCHTYANILLSTEES